MGRVAQKKLLFFFLRGGLVANNPPTLDPASSYGMNSGVNTRTVVLIVVIMT